VQVFVSAIYDRVILGFVEMTTPLQ
jgi:hypothetical protein